MGTHRDGSRHSPGGRAIAAAATALACLLAAAPAAGGQATTTISTGGAEGAGASSAGGMGGGSLDAPGAPTVRDVICQRGCVGLRRPTVGGVVEVVGRELAAVTKMSFPSADGRVLARVVEAGDTTASAIVPAGATDGKVRVRDDFGNASRLSPQEIDIRPVEELGSAGELTLAEAAATPRTAFLFGVRRPRLDFVIGSSQPLNDLRIDVVNRSGEVVRSFFRNDVEANTSQSIRWNGKTSSGRPAPSGAYQFTIRSQAGRRAARARSGSGNLGFKLYGHIFPVRGPHTYGDGIGAPRAGHTHQGVDVFGACGTRMVAARGGKVQTSAYHSSAGYYIVIDGRGTGVDYVYMHMVGPSPHKVGQTVKTGEYIGKVGESGNASGCHVHYEMWGAPGWYEGGSFLDPMPLLKRWDRYS